MRHYFGTVRRLSFLATLILLTLMCLFTMNFISLFSKTVVLTPLSRHNSSSSSRGGESTLSYYESPSCVDLPPWQIQLVQRSKNALVAGRKIENERKQLVLGIASVWRDENYLQQTLSSLVQQSEEEERKTAVVVIYLADSVLEKNQKQLDVIKRNFQPFLDSGFFQVIQSGPEIYPPMDFASIKRTFNDSKERVLWRTKQVIDFVFLMTYSHPLGDFYMVVEDDVIASNQYITAIKEFISTRKERRWAALQFTGFLGIGLLFRSSDLPQLTQLLVMFHQNQPVDMLMREFIALQVQEANLIVRRIPSLLNHIGVKSSLPNKVQKLTDNTFNMADRKYKNTNPPADLVTSMKVYNDFFPEYAYRKSPGFFWGIPRSGGLNDTVDIVFHSPINIYKFVLISGLIDPKLKLKDSIKDGILEVGDKFQKISSNNVAICDNFRKIQSFRDNLVLNKNITGVQCVRIRIGPGQKSWVIIREIEVMYK